MRDFNDSRKSRLQFSLPSVPLKTQTNTLEHTETRQEISTSMSNEHAAKVPDGASISSPRNASPRSGGSLSAQTRVNAMATSLSPRRPMTVQSPAYRDVMLRRNRVDLGLEHAISANDDVMTSRSVTLGRFVLIDIFE